DARDRRAPPGAVAPARRPPGGARPAGADHRRRRPRVRAPRAARPAARGGRAPGGPRRSPGDTPRHRAAGGCGHRLPAPGHRPPPGLPAPLDLELRAGRLTALTGPSGAGKTTVLRTLLGDADPTTGTAVRPEPARIAAVPQNPEHSFVAATVRAELTASPWA